MTFTRRNRGARLCSLLVAAAALLAIPASAQAWTISGGANQITLSNDVPLDGDSYNIGYIPGSTPVYEIAGINASAVASGTCSVLPPPKNNFVHCLANGVLRFNVNGSFNDGDVIRFDTAGNGTPAPFPNGISTEVRTFKGADSVTGSRVTDTILGYGGNDTLRGQSGRDVVDGGNGKDSLFGGPARDRLRAQDGDADFTIDCGTGNDKPATFDLGIDPAPISC